MSGIGGRADQGWRYREAGCKVVATFTREYDALPVDFGGSDEQDFWNRSRDSLLSGPLQSGNGASRRSVTAECPGYETGTRRTRR